MAEKIAEKQIHELKNQVQQITMEVRGLQQRMEDSNVALEDRIQHMEDAFSIKMDQILAAIQQMTTTQSKSDNLVGNGSPMTSTSPLGNPESSPPLLEVGNTNADNPHLETSSLHPNLRVDLPMFNGGNTRLIIHEVTYDCDTDSEGHVEDSVDDDLCDASGVIPKLQFRKEASKAQWVEELGMAEVLEKKGRMWITSGIVRDGKLYCLMEETLYLAEIGALDVVNIDGTLLSLSDLYEKVAKESSRHGCSWESLQVYRHLKFLGYIVGRHSIPWTVKKCKIKPDDLEGAPEHVSARELEDNYFITELMSNLHFDEMGPLFDVYSPNSKFKKSAPGDPSFLLCLASGHPPSRQEIENLERRHPNHPLKFCTVEHGRVSFFSFTKVELPILP